ncbi:hypothetical protein BIV57_10645 [Mangrovactinospora gilvigrisea]|uniref:DUF2029 domain-containing protein n=1 Tax=Mangrovactinospora gilvigrisea TaxID=1428644 RepID=A0A1J7C7K2_9ACTN|nr:hypothetical protein BIV57_10645 [Mangrovactinospora gilvigrisea]
MCPTVDDPVARAGSELIGGPAGRRIRFARRGDGSFWTPLRVMALCAVVIFALGMVQKYPCYAQDWFQGANAQYVHACYSDIPHLYQGRGFAGGQIPYVDRLPDKVSPDLHYLEYPVLTGVFMQIAAWLTPGGTVDSDIVHREQIFYLVNAGMLMVCLVIAVVAVARTHRRRPWDAALLALSPAVLLNATINWDLFAVALLAVGMALWARKRPVWAGVLFGLATAAKLYPVLIFGPLLVLCWRAGRWRALGQAAAGAAGAWLVVNIPWMIANPTGWATFYTFSQSRGEDYGSFWLVLMQQRGKALGIDSLNAGEGIVMVVCCAAVGLLALAAKRRPRLPQLAFLVVAAFVLSNKVYSPQYVVWLVPLAALARPRWRDLLIWQAGECLYFLGIWMYLAATVVENGKGLPQGGYHLIIMLHILCTLYLCGVIVRDILAPDRDPVRLDGSDDPAGGVLDGAPDRFTLRSLVVRQ